jgi:hypothetical protein
MIEDFVERSPFATNPLCRWDFNNVGPAMLAGTTLPNHLPDLADDDETPPPLIERAGNAVTMHFHGIARFRIDFGDTSITAFDIEPGTSNCVIVHILHDHIAPRLLAELGDLVLHASAVRFGDELALFLGATGAGKSTLATSLHQAGYQLLGDDAAIVTRNEEGYMAQAVYPSLRLYPETIATLLGGDAATSPMSDHSDKQNVHLPSLAHTPATPLPVAAIVFLDGECGASEPAAAPLDSTRACIAMIEQSFSLDPRDRECAARRLAALSQLALAVPAYRLSYPHDFARLGQVHEVIETILKARRPSPEAKRQGSLVR